MKGSHLNIRSETNLRKQGNNLQQLLIQKDRHISQLQSSLNKLQLKNKQLLTFETLIMESENKVAFLENQNIQMKQQLRQKITECQNIKKKLKDIQTKTKSETKQRASFVKKQDYDQVKNQLRQIKQKQKIQPNTVISALQQRLEVASLNNKKLQQEKQQLQKSYNIKNQQLLVLKSDPAAIRNPQKAEGFDSKIYQNKQICAELEKINIQLENANIQKQKYRNQSQILQKKLQEYVHTSSEWSTHNKNIEYLNKISQYEDHIQSMASKLSAAHKIEMQKNQIQKQRRQYKIQAESLTEQNKSLKYYIDSLQQKIRKMEQYGQNYLQIDMQRFLNENGEFTKHLDSFFQRLISSQDQMHGLRQKIVVMTKIFNEPMLIEIENTLGNLQKNLNNYRQKLHQEQQKLFKEEQKSMKLQKQLKNKEIQSNEIKSELGKINRMISQKMQKIEFQSMEIKRLEKQNAQKQTLSQKCAKLQKSIVQLQNKIDDLIDENNELLMTLLTTSIQMDRVNSQDKVSSDLVTQIQNLNAKAIQNQKYSKNIQERIIKLQRLHKMVVEQSVKISDHLHSSHRRWNHYDISMQQLSSFFEKVSITTEKTYQQIDKEIGQNIKRHQQVLEDLRKRDQQQWDKMAEIQSSKNTSQVISYKVSQQNGQDIQINRQNAQINK